jgi:hypothetical protein
MRRFSSNVAELHHLYSAPGDNFDADFNYFGQNCWKCDF